MNGWHLKDIIYVALILFNAGWIVGLYINHIRHLREDIKELKEKQDQLFSIANSNRDRISKVEGRLNSKR